MPRGRGGMVDARDLKSLGRFPVRVRVPPSAPIKSPNDGAGRRPMRNKRNKDSGDRIDEFGSYTGPSIMAIAAIIGIVALILFYSSSPRVGVLSVAVFLLAIVGVAALVQRLSS